MEPSPKISFEDTSVAFSYKSDVDLRRANFLFTLVNHPWISAAATGLTKFALNLNLPIEGLIRKTAFNHFVGGVTIDDAEKVIAQLGKFNVGTILDYSVEGEKSEAGFEQTKNEILKTLQKAKDSTHIPFSVFKVTGLAPFALLEKLNEKKVLSTAEAEIWGRVSARVNEICETAYNVGVPVLIDAEETWIQNPIDELANAMMVKYNRERAIVFNTYQLYRVDTLENLKRDIEASSKGRYHVGAKLVRGAYMEKERARAEEKGYSSPIQPDKASSDNVFNQALELCIQNLDRMSIMCGSHNEESNLLLIRLMSGNGIEANDKRVWFAQLFGMSDNISFNLAKAGYNVAKYVPYGPVKSVMPYLFRRAAENTSVAGQSSRELILIRKELKRRRSVR